MPITALGKVAVAAAGTRVRLTSGQADPAKNYPAQSIRIQAEHDNSGRIYVGTSDLDVSSGVGVLAVLGIPAANGDIPWVELTQQSGLNGLGVEALYLDASASGDGAFVSVITA